MTRVQARQGFGSRAVTFAALAAGATAIGTLAIGWITIRKLRIFQGTVEKLHMQSTGTVEAS
jgi:hypothetical protein